MNALDEMDLELARQRHAERIHDASLGRALAVSSTNADYAAGIGACTAFGIVTDGLRSLFRRLITPRRQPAGATR